MTVDMVTEGTMMHIVGQDVDAGIRLEEFIPSDMVAVPIYRPMRSILVGSPTYSAGRELPRTPADLAEHRCLRRRIGRGTIYRWDFEKRGRLSQ